MLVTTHKMLRDARDGGYAVGAFNVENAEMLWAVIQAAEELRAPVILQTTPSTLNYLPPAGFAAMARVAAAAASVPVAIHLDHGSSYDLARACIDGGYTAVMIDGSALDFEGNLALSKRVVDYALAFGIPVEAELGRIGGKEDSLSCSGDEYTDPAMAEEFVRRSGVSSLAISIGTAHGIYQKTPVLDLARISAVKKRVEIPLVLHGASGLSDEVVSHAVRRGICKVNFATELRIAFTGAVRQALLADEQVFDPKKYLTPARTAVQKLVKQKMHACLCEGKA